jgi:hypothetical protein
MIIPASYDASRIAMYEKHDFDCVLATLLPRSLTYICMVEPGVSA